MSTPRLVTLGETIALFRSSEIGSLSSVRRVDIGVGGSESNVAIGLKRLGLNATWIGRVGLDSLGDLVLSQLRGEAVDVVSIQDPDSRTGLMLKEKRIPGTSQVTYYRDGSAGSKLCPGDIEKSAVESADLLHVTGITPALSESAKKAVFAAVEMANRADIPVSFDVNHRASLWNKRNPKETYLEIAARSELVFAGIEEAQILVGQIENPQELAMAVSKLGPKQVVIKLGSLGCVAYIDGNFHEEKAIQIVPVDTVGAGDAFVAGYLSGLLTSIHPQVRLVSAVTAGAFACLGHGDWESFPSRRELGLLDETEPVKR